MPDPRDQYPIYVPPAPTDINEKYPIYQPLPPVTPTWGQSIIGTGLSTVPAVAGGLIGAPFGGVGGVAGAAAGSGIGSSLRQWYEMNQTDQYGRPLRQEFNPWLTGVETVAGGLGGLNKFPGFNAGVGKLIGYGAGQAAEGAAISGATEPFINWAETGQFDPNLQRMGQAAVSGAIMNPIMGFGIEGALHHINNLPTPSQPGQPGVPGAYDVQRPPTNLFDVPTPPNFARQQMLPGMENIDFGASYPSDPMTPGGMYQRQADSLFGPSETALQSGDPNRMDAITSQYDANSQQAEAFKNRQPANLNFPEMPNLQGELTFDKYHSGGMVMGLNDLQNQGPDAFSGRPRQGGWEFPPPPEPPPTPPPPPTEPPPVMPKGTGSDFEAAMRASLGEEPTATPTPPPDAPSGADQFPEYVSITNPSDKEFTYKWKTLGYYPSGTDKNGYLRLRRPDVITQPNTSPVVPPVGEVAPTRKGVMAPGETAAGDIIRVPRTMVDNKYLSNIGRGGYTKIGEEGGMVIFRRTGKRTGEVESSASGRMSQEMAQILVRLYPEGRLTAGDLGEFDVRKKINEILTNEDPNNLHDLIIDYRHQAESRTEMGDAKNAPIYQALSDAAQQRYLEIGGMPTRTDTPELQTLGGLLDRMRGMARAGKDETPAFERIMDQFEDTVNHLDPRDAQLMHSDLMDQIQEARIGHALSNETELMREMAEIVRRRAVSAEQSNTRIPPRPDDIDMGGAMGEWPPGNRIYGRNPPDRTGQLALPGMGGPRALPGVPEEGGLDVGAIRQRAVLDNASSGQLELPNPTQVPVGQPGVDQMRNVRPGEVESRAPFDPNNPADLFRDSEGKGLGKNSFEAQWARAVKEAEHLGINWKEYKNLDDLQWTITRKAAQETVRTGKNPLTTLSGGGAEVESSTGKPPAQPTQPISKFRRRVLRIRESMKRTLPVAPNYGKTRFLMPDGTRLTHPYSIHEHAAEAAGTSLSGVLESNIIRVTPGFESAHIESPITTEQAQVLADVPHFNGNDQIRVDVYGKQGQHEVVYITKDTTPKQLKDKVNAVTWRDESVMEHHAVMEDAVDSWNGMTKIPIVKGDNYRTRSVVYDRNQVLTPDEKTILANHPLLRDIHAIYDRIVKAVIQRSDASGLIDRTGTVIDPGVLALYKEHPRRETQIAILVNTMEHIRRGATPEDAAGTIMDAIFHEIAHVNPTGEVIKFDPREAMQDKSLGRIVQEYVRMQVMHGEADQFHDGGWLKRMIDLERNLGVKAYAQLKSELAASLTSQPGKYRPELSDLLQIYSDAARRNGPEIEARVSEGIESRAPGEAEGTIPGDPESDGIGATPTARAGFTERVKQSTGWGQGRSKAPPRDPNAPNMLKEMINLPTNATTTADLSYPGRQGLAQIFTPEFWKALGPSFGAASEARSSKIDAELRAKPLFQERVDLQTGRVKQSIAEEDGLELMTLGHHAGPREEATASRWIETGGNLPVISAMYRNTVGVVPRISNRMYTTFLNHLRANRYEKLMNLTRNMAIEAESGRGPAQGLLGGIQLASGKNIGFRRGYTPDQAADLNPFHNRMRGKEIADFVNTATGRGPLRMHILPHRQAEMSFEKAAGVLGYALFAPRNTFSRMRMLNPNTYIMATPFVRKQYLKAAMSTAAAWWAFTEMAKMADDRVEVSHDLTSADFGKVRIGDFRLDAAGGFQQFLVAYARLYQGGAASSSTGQFHKFGEGFQAQTQFDMGERLFANKLNPVAKFAWDLAHASEYNPFHVGDRTAQMFVPLIAQDFVELQKEDPDLLMPWMVPILFGAGSQIYSKGESISKFIDPQDDWVVKGGGLIDMMPGEVRDQWDMRGGGR